MVPKRSLDIGCGLFEGPTLDDPSRTTTSANSRGSPLPSPCIDRFELLAAAEHPDLGVVGSG